MEMLLKLFACAWMLTAQVGAPGGDPALHWKTVETKHFFIHYPEELEKGARKVAARVEDIYDRKTKLFRWEPQGKVHIVLMDPSDEPNGLATPLPYNTIYLYGTPPLDGSALDHYDDWLSTLLIHEFTHTVHLDMAKGPINKFLRILFGRFWLPNAPQQQWAHEGLAIFYETEETTQGRGRSSQIQMFLRTVSLEDQFIGIDRATYWNDRYPLGNSAYWYGIGFYQYLAQKYGEEKIIEFIHSTAASPIPGFMNFKTDSVFGKSLHRLWQEWRFEEKEKWTIFKNENPSTFKSKPALAKDNWTLVGQSAWDQDKRTLYAPVRRDRESSIQSFRFQDNGELKAEKIKSGAPLKVSLHKNLLFYAEPRSRGMQASGFDVFAYDLDKKKEFRITKEWRLRDPIIYRDQLIGVRTDRYESSLVSIPFSLVEEAIKTEQPLTDFSKAQPIYKADGFDSISKPEGSPSRAEIVFSMKKENGNRDLFVLNLEDKQINPLTDDAFNDYNPTYSVDGAYVYYSSDHFFGNSDQQVPNIFRISRETKAIEQVTDAITGAGFPTIAGSNLSLGVFHSDGYELEWTSLEPQRATSLSPRQPALASPRSINEDIPFQPSEYRFGAALLPRYIIPLFLYSESNILVAGLTGSRDPLGFHEWNLFGFHLFGPNRPGGSLVYRYGGISGVDLFLTGFSGITNYGRILIRKDQNGDNFVDPNDYYERISGASAGVSHRIRTSEGPTGFSLSLAAFYEYRNALLGFPSNTLRGTINNILVSPEVGHQWGGRFTLAWSNGLNSYPDGIGPHSGQIVTLTTEYSLPNAGSDFHQLNTTLSGKAFVNLAGDHTLAFKSVLGLQWLDVLYQRSYLVGGSLGENPFSNINRRSFPFRGLPSSDLRGEGTILGSVEYRFPLVKNLPGMGTAPLWLKNLHGALFSDGGQAFQRQDVTTLIETIPGREVEKFKWNRFSLSAGAEIRSDASLIYAPPLTYRLGYGYVLYRNGEYVGKQRIDEFYFQAGMSF